MMRIIKGFGGYLRTCSLSPAHTGPSIGVSEPDFSIPRFAGSVATSGSGGKSEALRLGCSEAERLALLRPEKRCPKTKLLDGELRGLAAFEVGFAAGKKNAFPLGTLLSTRLLRARGGSGSAAGFSVLGGGAHLT